MCLWCCISIVLLKSDRCEKILSDFLWDAHKYPSCCFVSVEIKTIYLEYIQQCFSTVFHLQKWRKAFSTFCKSLIFHIGFSDFDMVNLSNLEIVFYPFMTVAWVPHAPFFRRNVAYFQFLEKLHRLLMCMLRPSKLTADSVTSSICVIHAHYLHCHGENVEGRSVHVCVGSICPCTFFYTLIL